MERKKKFKGEDKEKEEKQAVRLNGNTKLLKCHFIFTKLSIGSKKVVVLSTTNFKPEEFFSSLLCHSNCMRFSTLDELLFYLCPFFNWAIAIYCTYKSIIKV